MELKNIVITLSYLNFNSVYIHRHSLQWRHNGRDSVSNHKPHDCLLNRLFRRRSKKTSKLRVTGLCAGNSPVTVEFPAQMASNAENVSIWWRHHVKFGHGSILHLTESPATITVLLLILGAPHIKQRAANSVGEAIWKHSHVKCLILCMGPRWALVSHRRLWSTNASVWYGLYYSQRKLCIWDIVVATP